MIISKKVLQDYYINKINIMKILNKEEIQELEGKLFVNINMYGTQCNNFTFRKDFYIIENGIVYDVGDGNKCASGDTCYDIYKDCKCIGKYDSNIINKVTFKILNYEELIKHLEL